MVFFHSIEKTLWRDTGLQKESFHFERIGLGMSLREVEMEEGYLHMQKNSLRTSSDSYVAVPI